MYLSFLVYIVYEILIEIGMWFNHSDFSYKNEFEAVSWLIIECGHMTREGIVTVSF